MANRDTTITADTFGTVVNRRNRNIEPVIRYTFKNDRALVRIISYGATVTSIELPDRNGRMDDVVLGFDDIEGYLGDSNRYFGATIGRCANRIANGSFRLEGRVYELALNAKTSHLHGGNIGFDKVNWNSYIDDDRVIFTYLSEDGEEGYPGDLLSTVTCQLISNKLIIAFEAVCTKTTVVNLTNHSYFNLAGQGSGSKGVYGHIISINADKRTILDENMTATGELKLVGGTEYDLRTPTNLGDGIRRLKENGYDFNYCLNKPTPTGKHIIFAARAEDPNSGRYLEVHTDQPGVQFYTGNFIPDGYGKRRAPFGKHSAFCLETQNYPNAININSFPNSTLKPGERYCHTVWYTFGVTSED